MDESESEEFLVDENSLQVCSTDTDESKMTIADESYTEESKSECVHKNTKKKKTQITRHSIRNPQLRTIQLSRSQDILTYSNMKIFS